MIPKRNDATLQNDNRAVAPVVGFILIFAILVLAFVQYQAQVVPQQNAETEFKHFEEHQNEMVELRSAILTAGTSDRDQYPTVQLGTTYQTRTLALNGPPPAGTLQTRGPYTITISDESGTEVPVETHFLEYQPGYFEIDVGSTWYENSVLYLEESPTDAERVFIEDQKLINKGTLQITALKKDFQRTGTDRVTLELRTLENQTAGNFSELEKSDNLTVEMPTRLERNYWHDQLNDSDTVVNVGESTGDKFDPGVNRQNLTVDNVTVNSIGIRDEPDEESVKYVDPLSGGGSDDPSEEEDEKVWEGCPSPPSPPAEGSDGVRYISEDPSGNINPDGDTIVVEDGVDVSANINNPGDVFIGEGASVSSPLGASGDIVFERDATLSGNINGAEDVYMLPGSSISTNVGVDGTVYLISEEDQIGGKINNGDKKECSELSN